jgi:DNA-binding SARP family transcriptional activator/tetratricopeptide (TPR) repeat protein
MLRLLGPVELTGSSGQLVADSPRQRLVLASLAVDAGRPVPAEVLVDRVWGTHPPPQIRRTLQSYIARIRRLLADALDGGDPVRVDGRGGTYVLRIDPQRVDLHRFRWLVGQARAAACPPVRRVELLREAMELWRGPSLTGLDSPWAKRMRESWQYERVAAAVAWADAELAGGDPAVVVALLADLSREHPLVEPLTAALMRVLARVGRTADALQEYQDIRHRLAEELGTDPGAPLQEVHRAVLRGEVVPACDAQPSGTPAVAGTAPALLPLEPATFVGRGRDVAALDALLAAGSESANPAVAVVSGTAGIGKTTLAVHWAHRVADRFPDGQLYVNLRGLDTSGRAVDPASAIRGFLEAFGVPARRIPATLPALVARYRAQLAGKRVLVVLDNAADADQVRPLLPATAGCCAVVTSRRRMTSLTAVEGACPLTLGLLPTEDAWQLLARRLGADRLAREPDAVAEIIARCARLPLALAITAARAASHPTFTLASLAAALRDAAGPSDTAGALDALRGDDPAADIRAVFSWSKRLLGAGAARLFRLLGLHPGPDISAAAAASLAAIPLRQAQGLLADLEHAHLVTEHRPGRYTMHDLLRVYAVEQAHVHETAEERRAAVQRTLDHYLHTGCAAATLLYPHRSRAFDLAAAQPHVLTEDPADLDGAVDWLSAEYPVFRNLIELAAANDFDTYTWQLVWAFGTVLQKYGRWQQTLEIQHAAVAAASRLGDPVGRARALIGLAFASTQCGRLDKAEAHYADARQTYDSLGDLGGEAHARNGLAVLAELRDRPADALVHARAALKLFRAAGDAVWAANMVNFLGTCHARLGDQRRALRCHEQALRKLQELGSRDGQAWSWQSFGNTYRDMAEFERAADSFQHATDLFRELGDRYKQAESLTSLGDTWRAALDVRAARTAWKQARDIFRELQHPDADELQRRLDCLEPALSTG